MESPPRAPAPSSQSCGQYKLVLAGVDDPFQNALFHRLNDAGYKVDLVVEDSTRPVGQKSRRQPALFGRMCESIYMRLLGGARREANARAAAASYWNQRTRSIPADRMHRVDSLNSQQGIDLLSRLGPDVLLAYGPAILGAAPLRIPTKGALNIHTGLLPDYRGTLPEFHALLDKRYRDVGVSVHVMTENLDAGDVLFFCRCPAKPGDTPWSARLRSLRRFLDPLPAILFDYLKGERVPIPQADGKAPRRTPAWHLRLRFDVRRGFQCLSGHRPDAAKEPVWPWPYRAAFAISTDIDDANIERFTLVRDLLRSEGDTPFGKGLGWRDFADSLFGVVKSPRSRALGQLSVFADEDARELSHHAPELTEAIRNGGIDCLHAWGDYNETGGFRRSHAEAVAKWLSGHDLRLPVWVNHGDGNNVQNLGQGMGNGDNPALPDVYSLDLIRKAGCRYFWVGGLSHVPGQGVQHRFASRLRPLRHDAAGAHLKTFALVAARLYATTKLRFFLKICHKLGWQFELATPLLARTTMRDGTAIDTFPRYGYWENADFSSLDKTLTAQSLAELTQSGGAMIFYTHLGRCMPTVEAVGALRRVDRLYRDGELWVTSVPKLLDHYKAQQCSAPLDRPLA